MNYLLFNPLARNGQGEKMKEEAKIALEEKYPDLKEMNVLEINQEEFVNHILPEDKIILVGGDGTLNHLANALKGHSLEASFYLYRAGTGNDFLRDINENGNVVLLNPYLENLPKVKINGKETNYINGIGFGIDGMVCEVADALKAKGETNINYTSIAIKLLLTKYKCPNAKVLVDGKELNFKKVWFASAMNGQYYGGGMMVAPKQDRLSDKLSFVIMRKACRLNALLTFSKIFKGEHLKKKKYCTLIEAKHIEVTFDRPTALQIDGEVVSNVTHYEAWK
ncbi:MAG: hypothetical protein K2M08_03540 [Anaeroplasmataceae bacterium]|nr:hypothetical protein [Anaeroplasmataceae bacterium]